MTATKTSKKTEDMLDQTFANFDSEITEAKTEDSPQESGGSVAVKKSSNMPIFIGGGIAAVGLVGYMLVVKPMLESPPQVAQIKQVSQVAPVQSTGNSQPVDPLQVKQSNTIDPLQIQQTSPVDPLQVKQANPVDPLQIQQTSPVDPLQVKQANPVNPLQIQQTSPVEPLQVKQANPVNQQVAVADELKKMFEQQTTEFQTILNDTTGRLTAIESTLAEQKDINKKVDERLTALENGKAKFNGKLKSVVSQVETAIKTDESIIRDSSLQSSKKAKPKLVKKLDTNKIVKDSNLKEEDSTIIVNKVQSKTAKDIAVERAARDALEVASLGKVEFHSIYGGRVWVKNEDGSLATFASGDRLPTGEIIKSISDENFEVVTNRRIIRN